MNIVRVGVDIAKSVFHCHGVDRYGKTRWRGKYRRSDWLKDLDKKVPKNGEVAMEACGSSHHWARELQKRGYKVKLMAAPLVKPYVKSNKNDRVDAEAICEAMSRPNMRFVTVKSVAQQDVQALHRVREECVGQRTAKAKLAQDLRYLDDRVEQLSDQIQQQVALDPQAQRLMQLRGVGPMVASALIVAIGNGKSFTKGRDFAASLGLTPRQHSTGGKERLLGISKRGNPYLRKLLVHGARAVIQHAKRRDDPLSQWINDLAARKHTNVATVALANKTARVAWALIHHDTYYDPAIIAQG